MSDKPAAIGAIRQPSSPAATWRNGSNLASDTPVRRMSKLQRAEQERLDRYGRFGRR